MEREGKRGGEGSEEEHEREDFQMKWSGEGQPVFTGYLRPPGTFHQKAGLSMSSWGVPTRCSLFSPALGASDSPSANVRKGNNNI